MLLLIVYYSSLSLPFSATLRMLLCPSGVLVPTKTFSRLPIRIIAVTSDHNFLHQTQLLSKTGRAILAMNGVHLTNTYTIFALN